MSPSPEPRIVLVTAPDIDTARTLAQVALEKHLVACANLVPQLESHYWWRGKLETSAECLIIFKTTISRLPELEACILANHPYEVPEFVVLPIVSGSKTYLNWLLKETE